MRTSIYIFLIGFCCISCEEFLERPPRDAIGTDDYWKTANQLERYILKFYPGLPSHGTWYNGYGYEITNADNAILETPNIVMNGTRGAASGRWTGQWSDIRSINIFFDNYQNCEDEFDTYKHYVGEAHFFRAWHYFDLVKQYGDVPWYSTELLPTDGEELLRPRDSRTLVVDSILADLDKAIEYLDYRSEVGNNRINKEAALAFKSRVALFEGTWQKYHAGTPFGTAGADPDRYFQACIDAAEAFSSGPYEFGIHADYYEMFGLSNMSDVNEVLLYKAYNIADGLANDVQYATTLTTTGIGLTWSLVSSYLGKDGKPYDYLAMAAANKGNAFLSKLVEDTDPRLHATVWMPGDLVVAESDRVFDKPYIDQVEIQLNPTGFQLKKGSNPGAIGAGAPGGGGSETGYILFRYGEVLLNYTEALYELRGEVAYDALNQLRTRAGMPAFTVNPQSADPNPADYGYTISDELYEIRRERRVELAVEGFRGMDYRRWAAHALFKDKRPKGYPFEQSEFQEYQPPLDENGLIDYYQADLPGGYQFRENQDYLNPIPVEELTLNPNLEQNPGW